jgi:Caspase domain
MKHALLIGVPNADPQRGLYPAPNLLAMTELLRELGHWAVTELSGTDTSRDAVLRALEAMVAVCGPEDTCLFYFFGHGGIVRFSGLAGDLGRRVVFYLATHRPLGSPMVGVLDFEISTSLARLDRICGNVTAILDCCHAASIVREWQIPTIASPAWVTELDRQETERDRRDQRDHLLAVESHPRIVRLFASSSLRHAYAKRHADGHHGRLTHAFVQLLREANLRCDRLSWDTVAHRVREQVSLALGAEDQRVVLAGPRQRLVFSRQTIALPRSAAFIPSGEPGWGWLRVGLLHGVETGDQWKIAALTLDDDLEHRFMADARVRRVELDRCEVSLLPAESAEIPAGASAIHQGFERRMPVAVNASSSVARLIAGSGLLQVVPMDAPSVIARVRERPGSPPSITTPQLELHEADGRTLWEPMTADESGLREVVELLEDRARAQRLLTALQDNATTAATETALHWRWGRMRSYNEPLELTVEANDQHGVPRLHVGDLIWIELMHRGFPPMHWFVSVIEIGVAGRPQLLNTREPEGMEVAPGPSVHVGKRGLHQHQGLPLHWPPRVPREVPCRSTLLVIASRRPISLGHVVRSPEPEDPAAFLAQGLLADPDTSTRGAPAKPPVASSAWTWGRIDFELDPHPR